VAFVVPTALVGVTLRHPAYNETFFVDSAYYALFAMLVVYATLRLRGIGDPSSLRTWIKEYRIGILVTALVSAVVLVAVAPGFRVLADEANLVGVSKNLFFHKKANLAVTGKWYFDNYWNIDEIADRRPALFPFLVSLLHVTRGYRIENAFLLNALLFVLFVFSSYRLAKCLGGELFGVTTALAVSVSPNTLVVARSAGFDLLATLMLLFVVQSLRDYVEQPSPRRLVLLALTLCLLAHVRYEGWALLAGTALALLALGLVKRDSFRGYGFVYGLLPLFLLPRYWQAVAKAHDAEQPLSTSLFHLSSLFQNSGEYLRIMAWPWKLDGPHSPLLLILGVGGLILLVSQLASRFRAGRLPVQDARFVALVGVLLGMQGLVCFSYDWGHPVHPASSRLFLWLDTFVSFAAAWFMTWLGRRIATSFRSLETCAPALPTVGFAILFAMHLPVASEARFVNALTLTRQAAEVWRFFERLGEKRILVLSDRPGLFTIMDYGALDISTVATDRTPLYELSRHLYKDIYLVEQVDLTTGNPLPAFSAWPDVETETVLEFQNTESESVRIVRVKKESLR
jgi:hypothetical protein